MAVDASASAPASSDLQPAEATATWSLSERIEMRGTDRWTGSSKGENAGCSRVNGARGSGAT